MQTHLPDFRALILERKRCFGICNRRSPTSTSILVRRPLYFDPGRGPTNSEQGKNIIAEFEQNEKDVKEV